MFGKRGRAKERESESEVVGVSNDVWGCSDNY